MFYSNNIELLKYTTIDMEAKSDHSAIYAEFNI